MKRALLLLLLATNAVAGVRVVNVGDRKVRVRTEGAGPAVVFEAGFSSTLDSWGPVLTEVAKFASVFAYDRAGYGQSDPVAGERTYVAIANELHAVLQQEKFPSPFLYAGHSYGGALARVYAQLYPADVSAIVFIEPMSEVFINSDPDREKHLAQQEAGLKGAPAGAKGEWAYLEKEARAGYPDMKKYGNPHVPMALIVGSMNRANAWRTAQMENYGVWILGRDDSMLIVSPNSGHLVMNDEPALVINAIRTLLFPNPISPLLRAEEKGPDAVIAMFREEKRKYRQSEISPGLLNTVGYDFLRDQKVADAIKVFAFNVDAFPEDANGYDSLGEAYAASGDTTRALASYRKSLELDPRNENAARVIKELESKKH
ncbi:MAG: alpha/beta fold hydrolase [Thermoanaerobaculia bacterium]